MTKVAVILGATGMDSSHLAELLLEKNYKVYGMIRRSSSFNTGRIEHILNKLNLMYGDMTDIGSIMNILRTASEDNPVSTIELYCLAAMSHVRVSFEIEKYCADVDAIGVLNVLQSIKTLKLENRVKFYQASTSELYGNTLNTHNLTILDENSPMCPISPYAIAKLYAYHLVKYYRQAYNMFCVNGILFNHTGPRRGDTFVCKKITNYFKKLKDKIYLKFGEPQTYLLKETNKRVEVSSVMDLDSDDIGVQSLNKNYGYTPLQLGNLNATRDFGYAKDYVYGMWLMLQQDKPQDYVLSTGRRVTIREFIDICCENIGIGKMRWEGEGLNEKGYCEDNLGSSPSICLVEVNSKYYRPIDLTDLIGDSTKARTELGWKETVTLEELVDLMINS